MEKYYAMSRKIMGILAVVLSLIMTINEDISVKVAFVILFFVVAVAAGFLLAPISKQMIRVGDSITNKLLRSLYYVAILPVTLLVAFVIYIIIVYLFGQIDGDLGTAIICVFLFTATTIAVLVPYIQTLIVLVVRRKSEAEKRA